MLKKVSHSESEDKRTYKVLFMGTPEFACPTLEALARDPQIEIPLVISQPDTKRGRKMKLTPSPVKAKALGLGIDVECPEKVSSEDYIQKIERMNLDAVVVLAYGQLLKKSLLDVLPLRFINIHGSLLPRWRGAAPIQRALMEGDTETGLSFQAMQLKLDSGPVIFEKKLPILLNEDAIELADRLSKLSAELVCQVVKDYVDGKLELTEQDESLSTYARKIDKNESLIDWSQDALVLHNKIRGLQWGPGAHTMFMGKRLKLSQTRVRGDESSEPSVLHSIEETTDGELLLWIGSSKGLLGVQSVQLEGKPPQKIKDFVNGYSLTAGQRFS